MPHHPRPVVVDVEQLGLVDEHRFRHKEENRGLKGVLGAQKPVPVADHGIDSLQQIGANRLVASRCRDSDIVNKNIRAFALTFVHALKRRSAGEIRAAFLESPSVATIFANHIHPIAEHLRTSPVYFFRYRATCVRHQLVIKIHEHD